MSASVLEKDSVLEGRQLKAKSLALSVSVTGNAVPASKILSTDLPGVALMIAEGQTSLLPAGVTTVTPADATGLFSVVLDKAAIGDVTKIYELRVVNVTSTQTAVASISNGYLVIDIDSAAILSAADTACNLIITYLSK